MKCYLCGKPLVCGAVVDAECIENLKTEIEKLKSENATIRQNSIDEETFEILKEEIKKETAKKIITAMYNISCEDLTNGIYWVEIPKSKFMKIAKKYGVDVEE